ncbi:Gfo/Idh/MocA family oxidoreductase [Saccharopolyspora erythraea]|uniref:Gfo/Idh/MocA family protein n=1 Tax=Saccharopolyspora erythraea TaxID=1836 RepID=UPI001BA9FC5A|nr:Gfo/Idh/MocA family oxidoreductase [Saccharopolyspora erythraea]QUH03013.1 Gfo/Idh/MocA family oxidoreductase [Saccharopolyspora erythraea]
MLEVGDAMSQARERLNVGILGTGTIFGAYARGLSLFPHLPVVRVADLDLDRARDAARQWRIPAWGTGEELLADDEVDIVVNITPPSAHARLTDAALRAGKHVYVEKPLAATMREALDNLATAKETGRVLGSAPDTFLGTAGQTARAAIDAGLIGRPFAGTSFARSSKAETWHADPSFLFQAGGGPVLDWGPYHVAALVNLLGPVGQVAGATLTAEGEIAVTAPRRRVERISVEVPTHATGVLRFESGALVTTMYSFDVWDTELPHLEIYGTEGTLQLPDPNTFDQPVRIRRRTDDDWSQLPPVIGRTTPEPPKPFRALGVADLAAHLEGDDHRTSGEFAYHVCEVLDALQAITLDQGPVDIAGRVERPAPALGARHLT